MNKKAMMGVLVLIIGAVIVLFFILRFTGITPVSTKCPEGVIPERIIIEDISNKPFCATNKNGYGQYEGSCIQTWLDGTKINNIQCITGKREGQNINYFYCNLGETLANYVKTNINSDGTIGKTISLKIELVLDKNNTNENGTKVVDYSCG